MAGSIKVFLYVDDSGRTYTFAQDESNGESIGNIDFTAAVINPSTTVPGVPKGLTPRYARYQSDDGRVARQIIVSTVGLLAALPATIAAFFPTSATATTAVTLTLKSVVNESYRAYTGSDTGLNDGDVS